MDRQNEPINFSDYPFSNIPGSDIKEENFTKVIIEGKQLTRQYSLSGKQVDTSPEGKSVFKFIAPDEILSQIGHEWSEYQGYALGIAKMANNFNRRISALRNDKLMDDLVTEITKSARGVDKSNLTEEAKKGLFSGFQSAKEYITSRFDTNNVQGFVSSVFNNIEYGTNFLYDKINEYSPEIPFSKVDAAVTYRNTPHREFTFTFELICSSPSKAREQVFYPANRLMELSCADKEVSDLKLTPPYIFNVYTEPFKFIQMKNAALISVQTNWKQPYHKGYPSQATVTCSFKEIDPAYRSTFNVNSKNGNSSKVKTSSIGSPRNDRFSGLPIDGTITRATVA